jgi:hypothetical protein
MTMRHRLHERQLSHPGRVTLAGRVNQVFAQINGSRPRPSGVSN